MLSLNLILSLADIDSHLNLIYSIIASLILSICIIAFILLLLTFRYNLLYVYQSTSDLEDILFSAAWNQMFIEIYIMKLCAIELFLMMRKQDHSFECIGQTVIAIIIIILTVIFQILLTQITRPVKKYKTLAVMNDNTEKNTDIKKAMIYSILTQSKSLSVSPCSTDSDIDSRLNTVSRSVEKKLTTITYKHESFSAQTPIIWIPKDKYDVNDDEIRVFRTTDSSLKISHKYACFQTNHKIIVTEDFWHDSSS